ncbi:MAG: GTP pyrophosphokinase family protein [Lachnospiraceae bacterium]|nr:GTP pyrophosphokinase family protein [Lachnospiraceae bacterium]
MDNYSEEVNKFKKQIKKLEIDPVAFKKLMMEYECAIYEVKTKLDVLNNEFKNNAERNPIESIKTRIKTPESLYEKLERKGIEKSLDSIKNEIFDVAGIRVVCPFIDDIYTVADMLSQQDDITIISRKDYIKNPKKNGYRSLHLVVEIPIFLSTGKKQMYVEVQIRTIAMNFWASLEHQIHYKKFANSNVEAVKQLAQCADVIYETDLRMLGIRRNLIDFDEEE